MNTVHYLDEVKTRLNIKSDYGLAKRLGVGQSAIIAYRAGRRVFDDEVALTIAQALELNPLVVIAAANAERAKTDEQKARWMGLMDKLSASFNGLLSGSWSGPERRRDYASRLAFTR